MKNVLKILIKKQDIPIVLLIILFTLVIISIWFYDGVIIAGGEEGFSIFNNRPIMPLNGYWEEIGTGFANPTNLGRIPISYIVAIFSSLGMEMWLIQAIYFFTLILVGIISFYFMLIELFANVLKKNKYIFLIGSFFYFLNLYSLSQIWARFLYSHMTAWALLPLFLLLLIRFVKRRSAVDLLYFIASSSFLSLAFMQPAFVLTIWFPAVLWTVVYCIQNKKKRRKIIYGFLTTLLTWVITNIWWIYPYIILSKSAFLDRLTTQSSIDSLRGVSQYFPSEQIFLLKQSFGFGELSPWYNFYSHNIIILISVVIFLIVCFGIAHAREKNKYFFLVLLFAGWFVSKGTNPPFGEEFYSFLFDKIPQFGILRNSYEKFGLVFVLAYTIFFVIGIQRISKRITILVLFPLTFSLLLILNIPLVSGQVFEMNKVKIPQYYQNTNAFLTNEKNDKRILLLPMLPGDGIDYKWGYQGVESSEYFFDKPSISKMLRQPYFDSIYQNLIEKYLRNETIYKELDELHVGYLLLNDDVLGERRGASSSAQVEAYLKNFDKIKKISEMNSLTLYKYSGDSVFIGVTGSMAPSINYKKIDHEEYLVFVKDAKSPFTLYQKSSFNPLWKATIDGEEITDHFVIFDYANAWKIDRLGDFQIEIKYKVWPWD